nr:hypothetical protein [Tanacetum cinerariifolium]
MVVDGSIDWDKETKEGNTEPRSLENFGMVAGIKIESDVDSEGEVVSADDAIPAGVSISAGNVAAAIVSPQSETEFALMGLYTEVSIPVTCPLSSEPSTNDFQTCDSSVECSRPNHGDHDSTDSISSVFVPASESRDTIVIDCDRQEDFPSICTSSIETDVKSSKTFYLHLIEDCDLHEQRLAKRNADRNGILGRRKTGKPVNPNRPKPVSAGQQNLVSAGQRNLVSARQQNPVSDTTC